VPPAGEGESETDTLRRTQPWSLRDLPLMLTGRDLLARASELVSITVEAIAWDEEDGAAQVLLLRGQTDKEAHSLQLEPDATAALRAWLEVSGIESGPVFQGVIQGGKPTGKPLARQDVGRVLKDLARAAGISTDFSAHGLRVGMAQDLVAENVETAAILQAAGWKSPAMLARYTRKLEAKRGAIARYYARRHK
jgi:integrase